ncbi:MAG: DUF2029 domain-containing protein, partial [Bacteroidetes bacterium]
TYMFLGEDFLSFWSAGWLANQRGYLAAYDPNQLAEIQYLYIPKPEDISNYRFFPVITFFLPVFLTIFQVLANIPLTPAFILWSLISFWGYVGYFIFICRAFGVQPKRRFILLSCLFYPFFFSMFWGQIGLILIVAVGEFFRAFYNGQPWRAGFWLGILMIKPQVLVLLPFLLLLQRQWKILVSFLLTAIALGLISLKLITLEGFRTLLALSDELANGYPTIGAIGMLNWRMIGENLSLLGYPMIGWRITWMGVLLTLAFIVYQLANLKINSENSALVFLMIFAATGLVSWHYHIHSAVILMPFFIILMAKGKLSETGIVLWIILPAIILFLTDIFSLVLNLLGMEFYINYPQFAQGVCGLLLSIWTVLKSASLVKNLSNT